MDDLNYRSSKGFGSLPIHGQLLLTQLEETLRLKPNLLNVTKFVNVYLGKLLPNPDVDWRHDVVARESYLDRLESFVSRLNPSHNSLKAHVLYHRLVHDRGRGVHDRDRFMAYIKLPRNVRYINPRFIRNRDRGSFANLQAHNRGVTLFPAVRDDEPLVRSYLEHFFLTENSYSTYGTYILDDYLKHVFAETKILAGLGDMERWYSMLPPAKYQALRERVDLDFAHTNKFVFGLDEQVSLDLLVKNAPELIVKVAGRPRNADFVEP